MEYLDGVDLAQEVAARGPLPVPEAVEYMREACAGMQEAHAQGIVHRDLKPSNLFLTNEGRARVVKILDFGIASEGPSDVAARLTKTETVMGTPSYMAPEQFRSAKGVDERADIWALGTTLYELLTGEPPFIGTATTVGVSIVTDPVRPIETLRPDVPAALRDVVLKALEKDRERRFATMTEFADALAPFGDGLVAAPRASARGMPSIPEIEHAETLAIVSSGPRVTAPTGTQPSAPATAGAVTQDVRSTASPSGARRWWPLVLVVPAIGVVAFLGTRRADAPARTAPLAEAVVSPPPSASEAPSVPASPSADTPPTSVTVAPATGDSKTHAPPVPAPHPSGRSVTTPAPARTAPSTTSAAPRSNPLFFPK
jgi:serine/threonine-protein kinase